MRTLLKTLLLVGFAATQTLAAAPPALANGTAVKPVKKVVVHKRVRVVADYDGTPVIVRRIRPAVIDDGGAVVLGPIYQHIEAKGALATRYFNGEPVRARP